MWTCPKCKREFNKNNQTHSCTNYPLTNHLKGKEAGAKLFNELIKQLRNQKIKFKIDSVPCCIHLINKSTFTAVWVLNNKIKIDFRLDNEIKSTKIIKSTKMSTNRYLYYLEIKNKKEITNKVLNWIKKSYNLSNE